MKNGITLVGYDNKDANRTAKVLSRQRELFPFEDAILVSRQFPTNGNGKDFSTIITKREGYSSAMLFELEIGQYVHTEYSLFVSHDGFILNPEMWQDSWLEYDFIGAPWPVEWMGTLVRGRNRVGNTGFCLRSRKFMDACFASIPLYNGQSGDVFCCQVMYEAFLDMGIKFAPPEIAAQFASENRCRETVEKPFGFHGWLDGRKPF